MKFTTQIVTGLALLIGSSSAHINRSSLKTLEARDSMSCATDQVFFVNGDAVASLAGTLSSGTGDITIPRNGIYLLCQDPGPGAAASVIFPTAGGTVTVDWNSIANGLSFLHYACGAQGGSGEIQFKGLTLQVTRNYIGC